jgi:hypothetical protein
MRKLPVAIGIRDADRLLTATEVMYPSGGATAPVGAKYLAVLTVLEPTGTPGQYTQSYRFTTASVAGGQAKHAAWNEGTNCSTLQHAQSLTAVVFLEHIRSV